MPETKSYLFAVQGEGRGHLTQALALHDLLTRQGHTVCCVVVGSSSRRTIPAFFRKKIMAPIVPLQSPNFATDSHNKSIQLGKTVWKSLLQAPQYKRSLGIIHKLIAYHKPDVILNFYEPLIGIYAYWYKPACRIISIAHQYLYLHPHFRFPEGTGLQRLAIKQYTRLTAIGSSRLLAISQYPMPQNDVDHITVIPPILRKELFQLNPCHEDFLLVYLLNDGYMDDIILWHRKNQQVKLHCFTDSPEVKGTLALHENLVFHSLDDTLFLEMMAKAKAVVSTAGFESVCEAMYLGKPVMMVPVEGHFEQYCNALDAERIGAGMYAQSFMINAFLTFLGNHRQDLSDYRQWVNSMEARVLNVLEQPLFPLAFPHRDVQLTDPSFSSFS